MQNECKYGKIAYWLEERDTERYADEWKAFRLGLALRGGDNVAIGMGGTRAVG